MKFIAHRGNINGRIIDRENDPLYIQEAIEMGFDAEIDLWYDQDLYLGHDKPKYKIDVNFIKDFQESLWIHCKDLRALNYSCNQNFNAFFHIKDDFTLTSKNFIWTYPNIQQFCFRSIIVSLDKTEKIPSYIYGICSDIILYFKETLN